MKTVESLQMILTALHALGYREMEILFQNPPMGRFDVHVSVGDIHAYVVSGFGSDNHKQLLYIS